MSERRFPSILLILGDIAALYLALGLTLLIRYGDVLQRPWEIHRVPFAAVFVLWILLFFIAGLYEQEAWSANRVIKERILRTIVAAGIMAVLLFYLVPAFGITPKTNLIIHIALSAGLIVMWRMLANIIIRSATKTNVLFFGVSEDMLSLVKTLVESPHLGFHVAAIVQTEDEPVITLQKTPVFKFDNMASKLLQEKNISLVVASKDISSNKMFVRMLYEVLPRGIRFTDAPTFYESLTGKIPVSLVSEVWFLENVSEREKRVFEVIKRSYDMLFAFFLGIPAFFITPLIAATIKLESRGPVFIRQQRVGKNGIPFVLYKFRSMIATGPHGLAENDSAQWAQQNDTRITRVGIFLRKTRLDELPQLINIFNGQMSFIGPRPERPEFIETLKQQIPFYEIRHLVRPGLSGWAQINFPYGASVEDTMQKLQYDLYYIKNRSIALDLNIALKTILVILSREGR